MSQQTRSHSLLLGQQVANYRALQWSAPTVLAWAVLAGHIVWQLELAVWTAAVVMLATAAGGIWRGRRLVCGELELFQHGLRWTNGRRTRHLLWNQIHELYQIPICGPTVVRCAGADPLWLYKIVQRDGRIHWLYGYESLHAVGDRIQHHVAARQLPLALEAFRGGYSLRFGRHLMVTSEGILIRRQLIAWEEVDEISIDDANDLRVIRRTPSLRVATVSCAQIPNLGVLDGVLRATRDTLDEWSDATDTNRAAFVSEGEEGDLTFGVLEGEASSDSQLIDTPPGWEVADDGARAEATDPVAWGQDQPVDSHRPRHPR